MNIMKLLKNIIMVIMGLAIIFAFTNVLAADNNTYQDLSQAIAGNNQAGNIASGGNLLANNWQFMRKTLSVKVFVSLPRNSAFWKTKKKQSFS